MRFAITKGLSRNLRDALRHAGYFGLQDRQNGHVSYVRRLSKIQHYPRFHLYIDEAKADYAFNLHLDQKQERYEGARAHNADYDEETVREEAKRISQIITNS